MNRMACRSRKYVAEVRRKRLISTAQESPPLQVAGIPLEDRGDLGLGESRLLHQNLLARLCQNAPIIAGPHSGEGYVCS